MDEYRRYAELFAAADAAYLLAGMVAAVGTLVPCGRELALLWWKDRHMQARLWEDEIRRRVTSELELASTQEYREAQRRVVELSCSCEGCFDVKWTLAHRAPME